MKSEPNEMLQQPSMSAFCAMSEGEASTTYVCVCLHSYCAMLAAASMADRAMVAA